MAEKAIDVLKTLVGAGKRWRATAPVDDDFVSLKIEFDMQLEWALRFLEMTKDEPNHGFVLQDWVQNISYMQQSVLITGVRGCDGLPKYHPAKYIQRWYRRCFMLSAMDGKVLDHPGDTNGGSFTGPVPGCYVRLGSWHGAMDQAFGEYLRAVDEVPHHFHLHLMHGAEILGYKHPTLYTREWWLKTYLRMVNDMHLGPETMEEMDARLSDNREEWLKRNDPCNVE